MREELRTSKSYSRLPCVEGRASCGCGFSVPCRGVVVHLCKKGIEHPPLPCGPGCRLKKALAWFGITATESCPCNRHAEQMDSWGAEECVRRKQEIIQWMRDEAERRKLPFIEAIASRLIDYAINSAAVEQKKVQP